MASDHLRLAPRIKFHRNGTVTLSGLSASDLKSVLTAASIHHYETEKDARSRRKEAEKDRRENKFGIGEVCWQNHRDSVMWCRRIRNILKLCDQQLTPPYEPELGAVSQLSRIGRYTRLRAVKDARQSRLAVERAVSVVMARKGRADGQ